MIREFGEALPGLVYVDRPGSYAFFSHETQEDQLGLIQTPHGFFLPGGGADPGEGLEDTLAREVFEETGFEIETSILLGQAAQYHWSAFYQSYFRKLGSFFQVTLKKPRVECMQKEHSLVWASRQEALSILTHEFQRFAVQTWS